MQKGREAGARTGTGFGEAIGGLYSCPRVYASVLPDRSFRLHRNFLFCDLTFSLFRLQYLLVYFIYHRRFFVVNILFITRVAIMMPDRNSSKNVGVLLFLFKE
jgi:hypothetical protein